MPQEIVIFDLEFTAWEGSVARNWSGAGEHREVVQIGALKIDAASNEIRSELNLFVRPRINSKLSAYFIALTGITDETVAREGRDLNLAFADFLAFSSNCRLFCYGRDDLVLNQNLELYRLPSSQSCPAATNLRSWFEAAGIATERVNSGRMAAEVGVPLSGREHDALFDCRSLFEAIRHLGAMTGRPPPWHD